MTQAGLRTISGKTVGRDTKSSLVVTVSYDGS